MCVYVVHRPPLSVHPEPAGHRNRQVQGGDKRRLHLQADQAAGQRDDPVRLDGGRDRLAGAHLRLEGPRLCPPGGGGAQVSGEPGRGLPDLCHHIDLLRAPRAPVGLVLAHLPGE